MTPTLLFYLKNADLLEKLKKFLEGEKYSVIDAALTRPPESSSSLAKEISDVKPGAVIMDYVSTDAFSVKVMQEATDAVPSLRFVFLGENTEIDDVVLAFNEGARGFLLPNVSKTIFLTTLNRVFSGPARFRPNLEDASALEAEIQKLGQKHSKLKVHLNSAQKLVNYLLATPLTSQPRKVLVLSDSGYQRELIKKILEDSNFLVITAGASEEALSLLISEKPRIIISDYRLEEGSTGVDFCKTVKFVQKYTPCYFVISTASEDMLSQIMAPGNGVDDCLLKPSSDSSVAEFVTRIALGLIL
jgi:DNA-binding NarL/FixJ family response regulator